MACLHAKTTKRRSAFISTLLICCLCVSGAKPPAGRSPAQGRQAQQDTVPKASSPRSPGPVLAGEPVFSVSAGGTARLSFQSKVPAEACCLSFGLFLPEEDLAEPRFVGWSSGTAGAGKHSLSFSLKKIASLYSWYTGAPNGAGRIVVRLQIMPSGGPLFTRDFIYGIRWVEGRFRRVPAVIEGPFIQNLTTTTAAISFRTDLPTRAYVKLSDPHGDRILFESPKAGTFHSLSFHGLFADTIYWYEVIVSPLDDPALRISTPPVRFKTAPPAEFDREVCFGQLGGSAVPVEGLPGVSEGFNASRLRRLAVLAYRKGVELLFVPGGLVEHRGQPAQFLRALRAWKCALSSVASSVPVAVTIGARDLPAGEAGTGKEEFLQAFAEEFPQPGGVPRGGMPPGTAYSFDFGNAHFALIYTGVLLSEGKGKKKAAGGETPTAPRGQAALDWLREDLSQARKRGMEHLFVIGCEPLSIPRKGSSGPAGSSLRAAFWRLLGELQVRAYLCTGAGGYRRDVIDSARVSGISHPVWRIQSAGAGEPAALWNKPADTAGSREKTAVSMQPHFCLYKIKGGAVTLTVFSESGGVIDRVALSAAQGRSAKEK